MSFRYFRSALSGNSITYCLSVSDDMFKSERLWLIDLPNDCLWRANAWWWRAASSLSQGTFWSRGAFSFGYTWAVYYWSWDRIVLGLWSLREKPGIFSVLAFISFIDLCGSWSTDLGCFKTPSCIFRLDVPIFPCSFKKKFLGERGFWFEEWEFLVADGKNLFFVAFYVSLSV